MSPPIQQEKEGHVKILTFSMNVTAKGKKSRWKTKETHTTYRKKMTGGCSDSCRLSPLASFLPSASPSTCSPLLPSHLYTPHSLFLHVYFFHPFPPFLQRSLLTLVKTKTLSPQFTLPAVLISPCHKNIYFSATLSPQPSLFILVKMYTLSL